jgi:hypothetical protein
MNEIVPDWILKRPYMWPIYGYVAICYLILQMIDLFPMSTEQWTYVNDMALSLYLVGSFPAAAWSYWLYRKGKEKKKRERWKTPGPHRTG